MTLRVLVVDDSRFFRRRVTEILEADPRLEVIGAACDGAEAVRKVSELKPDVITMDIEMPVMDGISAVRRIMAMHPTPIIMFSSLTTEGAKSTLDALEAGAVDFLPKRFEDIAKDHEEAKRKLCDKIVAIANRNARASMPKPQRTAALGMPRETLHDTHKPVPPVVRPANELSARQLKLVAIGTSTGGPVALQNILSALPANFPVPIILVQHMPGSFTPAFAKRLDQTCQIAVKEAEDGDVLKAGVAYLAPGGRQMVIESRGLGAVLRIKEGTPDQNYKPCVDVTFSSVNKIFPGKVLAIVLTGMGADGREGSRELKINGSEIWAQDQQSSVVYGMPCAVVEAGIVDHIYSLSDIGHRLIQKVK